MDKTQALIVGAGPTGIMLAIELAKRGIPVRIIERSAVYQTGSRAKGVQPRSLEVFDDIGIAGKVIASGNNDVVFRRYNGNQLLGDVRRELFSRQDTQHMNGVMIPQWKVEELLREKLAEYKVRVELGTELLAFSQTAQDVTAVLETPQGNEELVCAYLVGCDGGKSGVRKALNINFVGETHEDERALVGDVEVEGLVPDAWHIWLHPRYGFAFALCPFKCTKSWQLQAIAIPDENGKVPEPDLETFNREFKERTQMENVVLKNATWQSVYRVNVRMADKFRVGRVFIAGDAAHAHSIAGGLGMNTGIQDAYNLGWKMAAVLQRDAAPALLDTYEEERLPIAAWTLDISSERQRVMAESLKKGTGGLESIGTKDTTQLNLHYRYSSLSKSAGGQTGIIQAGDRAPDVKLSDGSWLFDLYRGTHFTVLLFADNAQAVDTINKRFEGKVKAYHVKDKAAKAAYGDTSDLIVVRPDGYIGLVAGFNDENAAIKYLTTYCEGLFG
jgi:2-polyprenyl-6-methoxyphenol hydroxylase-like FAD-dependent oxidoreductase